MKRWISTIVVVFMLMFVSNITPVCADGSDVTVSLPLTAEDQFSLILDVEGNGVAYDGDSPIKNGRMLYSLSVGKTKEFRIVADKDYTMKLSEISNGNIEVDGNLVTISSVSAETTLSVRFEKNDKKDMDGTSPTESPDSNQSSNQNSSSNTSSNTSIGTSQSSAKDVDTSKDIKDIELKNQEKDKDKQNDKNQDNGTNGNFKENDKLKSSSTDILTIVKNTIKNNQGISALCIILIITIIGFIVHKRRKG